MRMSDPIRERELTRGASALSVPVQHPVYMESLEIHRPRNLDWQRASALLYGDWGTSKAYVIGLAFVAAGYSSLPIILAVCVLTALVGINYMVVCRAFPEGGGVYSAAKDTREVACGCRSVAAGGGSYRDGGAERLGGVELPRCSAGTCDAKHDRLHSAGWRAQLFWSAPQRQCCRGSRPANAIVVVAIILLAAPHFTFAHLEPPHEDFGHVWVAFVGVILALSGVEAIANLTGTSEARPWFGDWPSKGGPCGIQGHTCQWRSK